MKLTIQRPVAAALWLMACVAWISINAGVSAQKFTTTTVQGTVYLANGQPGSGVLQLSWPAFTTVGNQAVAADRMNVQVGADGYISVNLAPNLGATPAGLYYTAVYHLSDGTTSTEYWVVPAAAQASLSQVRAQVMPAAQAVQAVSKGYVDQSIAELTQSLLTASGGSLSGPLFLNGDPTQPAQAATKRYVDNEFAMALPLSGGAASGPLTSVQLGAAYQVDQFPGADFGAKLQACLNKLDPVYGGTCDARNFTGTQAAGSAIVVSVANATVQLPCATIATASQIQIAPGTRNVTLRGCALRGASGASGTQGGSLFLYSGKGPMIQVGDPAYAVDTLGFHIDNVVINTTASSNAASQALAAYRTQEMDLQGLYLLGNSNQTGITLDGTGNYTGGTFQDIELGGFATALNAIGHQVTNAATTDWVNASTFLRLHIDCPTNGGNPITGTYGINLLQGDGNTFTGGDVEGCATALHLGPNAQNNTIVGLRNENSVNQVVADAGSSYNNWITGGTMFTGQLTDNGTRNSFLDTFHRSFNGLNGDWYGSQADSTITNHYRLGTGTGNERGLLNRYQTDYGYRWTMGLSDATSGAQFYQLLDELNSVYRLSIGQYNHGQASTNNQTVINAAGTGAVVLNGSANAGTGGVIFGSGGSTGATVATINSAGNAQFNGTLQVGGASTFVNSTTVRNQADAEIDSFLWAGASTNQKESFIYKDYSGASQWYMVKDASNNWALNSAIGGLDSFKAYQSNNSGDAYINASNSGGHIRLNYEPGAGSETDIYSGPSATLVAAFLGNTAIKFPGLAAASGHNCMQIDNSGYISNTGVACGTGTGLNGTVNAGTIGQVAYYTGNGTVIAGTSSVAVSAGGTGATNAAQALQNLGAQGAMPGIASDGASGMTVGGDVAAATIVAGTTGLFTDGTIPVNIKAFGADGTAVNDDIAICSAIARAKMLQTYDIYFPNGTYLFGADSPFTCGLTTPTTQWRFHGESKMGTILQGPTTSTLWYFYDNCASGGVSPTTCPASPQLTANNLWDNMTFQSAGDAASIANTNWVRHYSTGQEKRDVARDIVFTNLNIVLDAEGPFNADRHVFEGDSFYYVGTGILLNNPQAVATEFIGCEGVFTGDFIQIGANGGGEVYWKGGSLQIKPDTTAAVMHYLVSNIAASSSGLGFQNGMFSFHDVKVEFNNQYAGIANFPYAYGSATVNFVGGNLGNVQGGARTAIVLNNGKTVNFIGTTISSSLNISFNAIANSNLSINNTGTVLMLNCVTDSGWSNGLAITSTAGQGFAMARNCVNGASSSDSAVVDFTYQPFISFAGAVQSKSAAIIKQGQAFPYNAGHPANVVLPVNSTIKSITIHKNASGADAQPYALTIASSDGTTKVFGTCQTQGQYLAYDCTLNDIWYNVGTSATTRTVTITANTGAHEGTHTGFALVEYF